MSDGQDDADDRPPTSPASGARRGSPGSGSASIIIPVRTAPDDETRRHRRRRTLAVGGGLAVALLAGAVLVTRPHRAPPTTARSGSTTVAAAPPVPTAPPATVATRDSTPAPTPPPPARPPATAAEARAGVVAAVAAYAAAISSGDADAIARAYPTLSADDRAAWRGFLADARDVRARLVARSVRRVGDDRAESAVSGTYSYRIGTPSRRVRSTVRFRGSFARDTTGAWVLSDVR